MALLRDVFVHCLIILKYDNQLLGPKAFRFNNHQLVHSSLLDLVTSFWSTNEIHGWKAFVLMKKLKTFKVVMKTQIMEVFGNLESQIDKLKKEVSKVDFMADV